MPCVLVCLGVSWYVWGNNNMHKEAAMEVVIPIHQKECRISISPKAEQALQRRQAPLVAEIEVTLACCVRKVVKFREPTQDETLLLATPQLAIAVVSAEHRNAQEDAPNKLPPITNWKALVPRWLSIDFSGGDWRGDFGYAN